jgi:hypothetical protein
MNDDSKYRLYIDEVGNPDLESSHIPNHRFLSLTGVAKVITIENKNKSEALPRFLCKLKKYYGVH